MADPQALPVRLPSDASHPDHALYRQLLDGVTALKRWTPEQNANLAAALYAEVKHNPRIPKVDGVIAGDPGAASPSVFAVYQKPGSPVTERAAAAVAGIATPANESLRAFALPQHVGNDGYLLDPGIVRTPVAALHNGAWDGPNAIVMHRTESPTLKSALSAFATGVGTHFIIDKDGSIHQTASLDEKTQHVGKIRSRCDAEGTCTPAQRTQLDAIDAEHIKFSAKVKKVHDLEVAKPYPQRYPSNADSVGIEVVGAYDEKTKTWDKPTAAQAASINRLVGILQNQYGLDDHDVYQHDKISYKTQGEGAGLYVPAVPAPAPAVDPPVVSPGGPAR